MERSEHFAKLKEDRRIREQEKLAELKQTQEQAVIDYSDAEETEILENYNNDACDEEFTPGKTALKSPKTMKSIKSPRMTRSTLEFEQSAKQTELFPPIPVRTGYKTINPDIMECLVVMESKFKVDERKCAELLAYIANKVFHQKWDVEVWMNQNVTAQSLKRHQKSQGKKSALSTIHCHQESR